ncbi:macrophage mannose receptor 1-like isoform X6, partial [Clarias magur]
DLPLKNVTYTNWYPGEPANYYGKESCVAINSAIQWYDTPCGDPKYFICYD